MYHRITGKINESVRTPENTSKAKRNLTRTENSFAEVLEVTFSRHAQKRINDRNIDLTGDRMERLADSVRRARSKGANESLILLDNMAMVVNIKNSRVVTVMDRQKMNEKVFTNIDSAVIA